MERKVCSWFGTIRAIGVGFVGQGEIFMVVVYSVMVDRQDFSRWLSISFKESTNGRERICDTVSTL